MLTETEDCALVTSPAGPDETTTSTTREIIFAGGTQESFQDTLRVLRRQDIADHGVLFR